MVENLTVCSFGTRTLNPISFPTIQYVSMLSVLMKKINILAEIFLNYGV